MQTIAAEARDAILEWYGREGRRLPFRATKDPWAVLVSEAMAQQTQAARAAEAWSRFMAAFPTAASLAAATPADALRAWEGLGYNRRALNLWRAARAIVEVHGGSVPSDIQALEALPGVGPYTARAVAAIAFGIPVGAVDTNVRRVIGRMTAGSSSDLDAASLQAVAEEAVPAGCAGDWTHAVMDLGATVCVARRPACDRCPVAAWCRFAARAAQHPPQPTADAFELHQSAEHILPTRTKPPFRDTSRWLRGRIIDTLRDALGTEWLLIRAPIGNHGDDAVRAALDGLAREGLVELDRTSRPGQQLARLPVT